MKEKQEYGKIIINDNYYITRLDKYCLALLRKVTRQKKDTGEEYKDWEIAGYHGDLINALYQATKELSKDALFNSDKDLKETIVLLQEKDKEIRSLLKNLKITL